MPDFRYVTIDGEPPCGGLAPGSTMGNRSGVGNNGGYLGSGVIGVVYPRSSVGHNPAWRPWDNMQGIPTSTTAANSTAAQSPTTSAPAPPGATAPTTDKSIRLPSGMGYIFPKSSTTIHVIEPGYFPWENPRRTFQWRAYRVPTTMTVAEFVGQICQLSDEQKTQKKDMKNATMKRVIECIELGDGVWGRGPEFCVGEGRGRDEDMKKAVGNALAKIGWDDSRGESRPPVWVSTEVVTK